MVNMVVVRIAAERIMNGGLNPKTGKVYVIDDVTNKEYRQAIENYILEHTEGFSDGLGNKGDVKNKY